MITRTPLQIEAEGLIERAIGMLAESGGPVAIGGYILIAEVQHAELGKKPVLVRWFPDGQLPWHSIGLLKSVEHNFNDELLVDLYGECECDDD